MTLGHVHRLCLAALAAFIGSAGCVTPSDLLDGHRCPCLSGWTCDEARDLCVKVEDAGEVLDGGSRDASVESSVDGFTPNDAFPPDNSSVDAPIDIAPDAPVGPLPPLRTACWRDVGRCDWGDPSARFVQSDVAGTAALGAVSNPTLSPDGCTLYYPVSGDIVEVQRADALSAFGTPSLVSAINTRTSNEDKATVTPDGLEILLTSDRDSTRARMWRARRVSPEFAWEAPTLADELNLAGFSLFDPSLAPHGLRLYYAPSAATQRLYVTERAALSDSFETPVPLNDAAFDLPGISLAEPTVNHEDTVLVFAGVDGDNVYRLYVSERDDWTQEFGPAREVPSDFTLANQILDVALSPDGCELFVRPRTLGGLVQLVYEAE